VRLGWYFGATPEFCIDLQVHFDPGVADRTVRRRIEREALPVLRDQTNVPATSG
jgi:plasmid maintenance system antidote protein VapI